MFLIFSCTSDVVIFGRFAGLSAVSVAFRRVALTSAMATFALDCAFRAFYHQMCEYSLGMSMNLLITYFVEFLPRHVHVDFNFRVCIS